MCVKGFRRPPLFIVDHSVNKTETLWQRVWHDLQPYEGRWSQTWRIALLCMVTAAVSITYGIPEASISCYVLFFVMKSDAAESSVMALALVVLVSLIVAALIGLIQISIDSPVTRIIWLLGSSVVFMFLGVSSALGPLGGIIALVIAFVLTLLSYIPIGELATRAVLYAWLMVAMPMGLLLIASLLIGRNPRTLLLQEMATRLEYAAEILQQGSACSEQAHENVLTGIAQQQKRVRWVALFHLAPRYWQPWYAHAVLQSYGVLLAAYRWAQSQPQPTEHTHRLAQSCRQAAQQLRQQQRPHQLGLAELGPFASAHLNTVHNLLQQLADTANPERIPKEKTSFFVADAFSNPAYVRIALQTTLAALLCYLFYSAAQWDGIHTALITCYIVGLSNTGETLHKMLLRIIGCLIGVAITLVYWYVFIPHITSIGALMLAVFLVCLLAAWVVLGSERISYAGLQIAFAFLLINLTAGGPSVDMDMARDRIIGILLGNIMMYGFFTYLWPNSIMQFVQKNLNQANEALQQQDQALTLTAAIWHAANAAQALETARYQLDLAHLEPKSLRATPEELQAQRAQWQATQHRLFS